MPDIDDELIARALRWCADAGRTSSPQQVRDALAPLSWDELLAARALLADPPPARPLGPRALAELARGASPAEAAARDQQVEPEDAGGTIPTPAPSPPPARRGAGRRARRATAPVVRRARDRVPTGAPAAPAWPRLDELFASEGRAVLERLVREHGARRAPIAAVLAGGWRRADGTTPDAGDLARLLEAHGLRRGFERRERDELLHALRAAGGVRLHAAAAAGLSVDELDAALQRLGAAREAEAIRAAHRNELRRRGLLSDRARLLLTEEARLADLGLLAEFEQDLRARLPEHVRALRASTADPLSAALARSLSLAPRDADRLSERLGIALEGAAPRPAAVLGRRTSPPPRGAAPHRPGPAARAARPARGGPGPRKGGRPAPRKPRGA
jgi:hypothetical protein